MDELTRLANLLQLGVQLHSTPPLHLSQLSRLIYSAVQSE